MKLMKANVYHGGRSAGALNLEDIEKPDAGDDEVWIKVRAACVNPFDAGLLRHPLMRRVLSALSKSKINRPGRDVAGQVEAVGRNVTEFKPGDAVFGLCDGAFAEYTCASQSALAMKPDKASFEQAAAVPLAGLTSDFLNDALSGFMANADWEAQVYSAKAPSQRPKTASPGLNSVTFLPTASTWPATSRPGRLIFDLLSADRTRRINGCLN